MGRAGDPAGSHPSPQYLPGEDGSNVLTGHAVQGQVGHVNQFGLVQLPVGVVPAAL
jgi:hypothetical protein